MKENDIKGTIILAKEGINGSICGQPAAVDKIMLEIKRYHALEDINFNVNYNDFNPFEKSKVKLRHEIVTLGVEELKETTLSGTHLSPGEWNELLQDPTVVVVDTRNHYEVELGTFQGALNPKTENFRDFPAYVAQELLDKKDKKIAMFCTGGIRCEKSTALLRQLGFEQVYQLQGGILNYLATIPQKDSKWQGKCFVFDDRVAVDEQLQSLPQGSIDTDWKNQYKQKYANDLKDNK